MATSHPLAAVAKRRDRVAAAVTGAIGPRGFDPARAAEAALAHLPPGVDYSAVYRSLLPLGTSPSPATIREAAWAIAADLGSLRAKTPVYPPSVPAAATPVFVQFMAARRVYSKRSDDETKTRYRVRVVQGRAAPISFDVVWADRLIRYRAIHPTGLGFSRPPRGERPAKVGAFMYQHPDTLVGMLAKADLLADPKEGRPKLDNVRGTPSIRAYNMALTAMRARQTFTCPFSFPFPAHPCHRCPKGQTSCPAAVRPSDLVVAACSTCRVSDGLADPAWTGNPCVKCGTHHLTLQRSDLREHQ